MALDRNEQRRIDELFNMLDARINAVAAYVSALPGAKDVDLKALEQQIRQTSFQLGSALSVASRSAAVSGTLRQIHGMANAEQSTDAGKDR